MCPSYSISPWDIMEAGHENVETTSLAVLALDAIKGQDPGGR